MFSTMTSSSLVFFVILTASLVIKGTQTCNVPPDFWCDSYEIAQKCNVVHQCETFKRDRNPITISLMYEALCPFCQRFISNHLGNLINQFKGDIEIELNGQISCNHGQKECDANRLMSCAIDVVKVKQAIPFVICLERALSTQNVDQAMHHCSGFIRNQYRAIHERGQQLQRSAAHKTMSARAHPIVEVPYLLINNYSPSIQANNLSITSLTHLIQKWISLKRPGRKF